MFSGCSVGPEEYFGGLGDIEAWIPTLARVLEEFILVGWEPTNAFADTSLFQQIDRKYVLNITCRRCSFFHESNTVYVVIFAVVLFSRISRVRPCKNFHFNIWLFIVMKTF